MKLSQLLSIYPQLKWGSSPTSDIKGIAFDSRVVEKNFVFVAVRGNSSDGHNYLKTAVEKGAVALVVEEESKIPKNFTGAVVKVDDSRWALEVLASRYFESPAEKMFCVGVTGTNGKTTVCHLIEKVLERGDFNCGVLGTIDHHLGQKVWASELTTPDPVTLYRRLREFVSLDANAVAMEVSSHALTQARVDTLPFDVAVFTNLTRDHLDYHQTMENYFLAKQKLFNQLLGASDKKSKFAIVNYDDDFGRKMEVAGNSKLWSYGQSRSDFQFQIVEQDFSGSIFSVETPRGPATVNIPLIGSHNVYNATAALAVGVAAGMSLSSCVDALKTAIGARGRLDRVSNDKGLNVFVDYAHTNDALDNVLTTLLNIRARKNDKPKIITVFGCGGDRDQGKRPLMGKIAYEMSDFIVVTSDNPRTEDPNKIIKQILESIPRDQKVKIEPDRRTGIEIGLNLAKKGDIVLIAGKGHEDYQIVGEKKIHFSDYEVVKEVLG